MAIPMILLLGSFVLGGAIIGPLFLYLFFLGMRDEQQ